MVKCSRNLGLEGKTEYRLSGVERLSESKYSCSFLYIGLFYFLNRLYQSIFHHKWVFFMATSYALSPPPTSSFSNFVTLFFESKDQVLDILYRVISSPTCSSCSCSLVIRNYIPREEFQGNAVISVQRLGKKTAEGLANCLICFGVKARRKTHFLKARSNIQGISLEEIPFTVPRCRRYLSPVLG